MVCSSLTLIQVLNYVRAQLQAEKTRREEAERQAKELQDRLKAYETEMDEYRNGNYHNTKVLLLYQYIITFTGKVVHFIQNKF